jgi:hypothetical protein
MFHASLRHTSYMQGQTSQVVYRPGFLGSCTCQVILVKCFHFVARFKGKAISLQALTGRYGSGKLWLTEFPDNRHMEAVRIISPAPAAFAPQEISLVISGRGRVDARAITQPERLSQSKSSNDPIGNRTRDLPACSAVPHQRGLKSSFSVGPF